ncbi:MAG: DUF484 family protein [Gammaproteobacteria bacterium]
MNSLHEPQLQAEEISEEDVASYLRAHPEFFEQHQNLLNNLRLPHSAGTGAVSLVEKQVSTLRQNNTQLEQKLHDLVDVARNNDALATKIHTLATGLIAAGNRNEVITILEENLRTSFSADQAVLVLFGDSEEHASVVGRFLRVIDRSDELIAPFKTFLDSGAPRCGHIRDAQRDFLFGEGTLEIGSAALVPLGSNAEAGFLAIGNRDAEYFHPGKSMDFLSRLGDLVGCALAIR